MAEERGSTQSSVVADALLALHREDRRRRAIEAALMDAEGNLEFAEAAMPAAVEVWLQPQGSAQTDPDPDPGDRDR